MDLRKKLKKILATELKEIIASPLILDLLQLYSVLYINGKQPSNCAQCIKKYYVKLKKNGMKKMDDFEKIKSRTLVPRWKGIMYLRSIASHLNSELITDERAIELLEAGLIEEKMFDKLPEGYKADLSTDPPAPAVKKAKTKSKKKEKSKAVKAEPKQDSPAEDKKDEPPVEDAGSIPPE